MSYHKYVAHVGNRITATLARAGVADNAPARAVKLFDRGLSLERESKEPMTALWASRCQLYLVSETHYMYEHIARDSVDWTLTVTDTARPEAPLFVGRVERGLYEETYDQLPYEVVITAGCGLRKLADYYLPVEQLPRNEKQLTSAYHVLQAALALTGNRKIYPHMQSGTVESLLGSVYIDPDGYRTDEEGLRASMKAGEVLEQLLSSLALTCWLENGEWHLEDMAARHQGSAVALETAQHPIEASPTLSTQAAYGSVKITLPSDTLDSAQRLERVTLPLSECRYDKDFYFGKIAAPPNRISASHAVATRATLPTPLESAKGMQLRLPYIENETICIGFPYRVPADAKGLTIHIDLGFGAGDIDSPNGDDREIQAVAEIMLHNGTEPILMAAALPYCWRRSRGEYDAYSPYSDDTRKLPDPTECFLPPAAPEEERADPTTGALWGRCKEGITFTSPWAERGREIAEAYYDRADSRAYVNEGYGHHLPWSRVARAKLRAGKQGTFKFSVVKPFPSTLEVHRARRKDAVRKPEDESAQLHYVAVYIPMRFWLKGKDNASADFKPREVTVGKITLQYDAREERSDNRFLIADKGDGYMREGEAITLTYNTKIPHLPQPDELKGWLYNAAGERLETFAGMPLVERVARTFFAFHGKPHDTLSGIRTESALPFSPSRPYTVKGRAGHTYHLAAARWDAARQEAELTLLEAPRAESEAITYDV